MPEPVTAWLRRLRDMPNDSPQKTVAITLAVCLAGSVLVAGSAVLLKPLQLANKGREQQARISEIVARLPGVEAALGGREGLRIERHVVDLATGEVAAGIDPDSYDARRAAEDPAQSVAIPPGRDLAQIKRRAHYAQVFLVRARDTLQLVILPVHGRGYASTLYGYLGLAGDLTTVVGLSFYEHGETPGLGALVDDPAWRAQWRGKKAWDESGRPALGVAKGAVDPASAAAAHLVDGITGATWTSNGVTNLLRFWLGDDGYGPYLKKLSPQRG